MLWKSSCTLLRFRRIRRRVRAVMIAFQSNHLIANSVCHSCLRIEEAIAFTIFLDSLRGLARAFGHDADQRLLGFQDLFRLNLNIRRLPVTRRRMAGES